MATTLLAAALPDVYANLTEGDFAWVLAGICLVFFMQAGFAMVETGFTRAKNAGNIIMKNLLDFCLGTVAFLILGYGLMHGGDLGGVIGDPSGLGAIYSSFTDGDMLKVMFHLVFCATAATIVSGAMAERTNFLSYCVYSFVISLIVYPVSGHWIWGGGWLSDLGFHDFAGSTAVHLVGGTAALVGAAILGPRIGKYVPKLGVYDKKGRPVLESKAIPGHSLTLGALGVFILWFGWYGFNGSSAYAVNESVARVFITTTVAPSVSTITAMAITWIKYGKPDISMTLNGSLAGLVAVTAGCDVVSVPGAAIIGVIAGFVVVYGIEFIDKKLHIDDPVGAIGVHMLCGATGTLLVGIFDMNKGVVSGFIYNDALTAGEAFSYFGVQILGVVAVIAWVGITMSVLFSAMKKYKFLRARKEDELAGLDASEHGLASSYADFMPVPSVMLADNMYTEQTASPVASETTPAGNVPVEKSVPVTVTSALGEHKFTKISIVTRPDKFEALKTAMDAIGITGMTVSQVKGCGTQRGSAQYYRGSKIDIKLLPKIKLETVVTKIPVETVVDAAKKALYTGNYGDGKIFVYDVVNVIRIRTGEEGYSALQDEDE